MKRDDIEKITSSNNWIRIVYQSVSSRGTIIMKRELYDMKEKKMKKIFADCHSVDITFDYQPTMKDIYMSVLSQLKGKVLHDTHLHEREMTRSYPDFAYMQILQDRINNDVKQIKRIERTLNKWN